MLGITSVYATRFMGKGCDGSLLSELAIGVTQISSLDFNVLTSDLVVSYFDFHY